MSKFEEFRKAVKADLVITWGLQADMTSRLEQNEQDIAAVKSEMSGLQSNVSQLTGMIGRVDHNVRTLHENFVKLHLSSAASSETSRQLTGQMRLNAERFDKMLGAMAEEFAPLTELVNLEARVEARLTELERRLSA